MGRVLTNNTSMCYTIETALGTAGTLWHLLEPNSVNTFGAEITTVSRTPINKNRQRNKGATTDLDSSVEFEHDLTLSNFMDFIEGYCFSTAVNADLDMVVSNVDGTNDEYDVTALTSAQAGKLGFSDGEYASLIYARGFSNSANNGLKQLDASASTSDTAVGVSTSLISEASPPANAQVELAGLMFLDGTTDVSVAYDSVNKRLTITVGSGITGFDWSDFGLTVGQMVHLGSPDGSGGVQNALEDSSANDTYGMARVKTITATVLTLDKTDTTLQVASPTSPATLDLLFGKFVRNVAVDATNYLERSFQFEAEFPNLGTGGAAEYQYSKGNFCNTAGFNLPLTEKATVTFGFIGTDTDNPTTTRKTGAALATKPVANAAFNTSSDIARLRVTETDEDGLSTDFKSLTFTLNNNVSPEKVLGTLGAKHINTGNFEVDIEAQMLFTDGDVVAKIRDNETVTMDFVLKNGDGGIAVDVPAMTMGGGDREFPVNETVLINVTAMAFADPVLETSLGVSVFPVLP